MSTINVVFVRLSSSTTLLIQFAEIVSLKSHLSTNSAEENYADLYQRTNDVLNTDREKVSGETFTVIKAKQSFYRVRKNVCTLTRNSGLFRQTGQYERLNK